MRDIGKAFVAEIAKKAAEIGVAFYDNQGMRKSIADFTDHLAFRLSSYRCC
jgi:hypothetical protein